MQKAIFKTSVPFQTTLGTIITRAVIIDNVVTHAGDTLHIVALVDQNKAFVRYSSKCVFNKNTIVSMEPFQEGDLPDGFWQ